MKAKKLRRLIQQIREADRLAEPPITFRNLTVDFKAKTIELDGQVAEITAQMVVIPLLNTEHPIWPRGGR